MKLLEMVRSSGTRAGWYRYEKGDRTPHPDPEVAAIIKMVATKFTSENSIGDPTNDATVKA